MKISDSTLDKIHDVSIVTVAEKLGIKLYGMGDEGRRACCPYHEDQHPSLHFSTKRGCFKCFVCGAKGDAIKLVQDHESLSFSEACQWIIKECNITVVDDRPTPTSPQRSVAGSPQPPTPTKPSSVRPAEGRSQGENHALTPLDPRLIEQSMSVQSEFCQSLVSSGYLTEAQMRQAAHRYRLGATKDRAVIFWEIDQQGHCHNGKLMHYLPNCHRDKQRTPTWAVAELKKSGTLPPDFENPHCLFGLHQTPTDLSPYSLPTGKATGGAYSPPYGGGAGGGALCLVESEKTAVICSVLFPSAVWLSCGGLQMFKPQLLEPLVRHKLILFPDTDEKGEAFAAWSAIAQQASRLYPFQYPIRVSTLLELHATPDQKHRKIDLVDYLFESSTPLTPHL